MTEFKPEPGWLAKDVIRAAERADSLRNEQQNIRRETQTAMRLEHASDPARENNDPQKR